MSLLDHPIISERYFFPRPGALPGSTRVQVDGAELACWRSAPPSDRPVVVHFLGNGEIVRDWMVLFPRMAHRSGYEVFLAEYRGYGASTGSPQMGKMLEDIPAIAAAVGVPPERCVVFGRSVGSLYALEWIKHFPSTAGLVIESGIHDVLQRLLLRMTPEELGSDLDEMIDTMQVRLNHTAKLQNYAGPSLFLHAAGDDLVTPDHARDNHEAAQNGTLTILPNGGHNDILGQNTQAYLDALDGFLKRVKGD
jgi:pimeloyl-ACP methyl ester carboxylesterase